MTITVVLISLYMVMQIVSIVFMLHRKKRESQFAQNQSIRSKNTTFPCPAISVVTSLKGTTDSLKSGLECILLQKYAGAIEFIIAVQDKNDPVISEAKKIIDACSTNVTVHWIIDFSLIGLNPRSAKMAEAIANAKNPWIYWHAVDSVIDIHHFAECMSLINGDENKFATTFPVNFSPKSFGAKIETMGLNLEVTKFFAFSFLDKNASVAYGGSLLASRSLLTRSQGLKETLNRLTDDMILAQAFKKAGGKCVMAPQLTYVKQEQLSFKEFFKRQVRWMMIARYYMPPIFFISPIFWLGQILLIISIATSSQEMLIAAASVFVIRIFQLISFELLLNVPKSDMRHVWTLVIYDFILPVAWFLAIFVKKLNWAGDIMLVGPNGILIKNSNQDN